MGTTATRIMHPHLIDRIYYIYDLSRIAVYNPSMRTLDRTNHCKCAGPKDKIYALLGMIDELDQHIGIRPDYSRATTEVYRDVVISFIDRFERLDILASCQLHDKPADLP